MYACRPLAKIYRPLRSGNASRRIKAIRDRRFFRTTGYPGLTTFNSTQPPPSMRTWGSADFSVPMNEKKGRRPIDVQRRRFFRFDSSRFRNLFPADTVSCFNFVFLLCTRYITIGCPWGYRILRQSVTSVGIKHWRWDGNLTHCRRQDMNEWPAMIFVVPYRWDRLNWQIQLTTITYVERFTRVWSTLFRKNDTVVKTLNFFLDL